MKRLIGMSAMVVLAASLCWAQGGYFDAAVSQQEEKANREQELLASLDAETKDWFGDSLWRVEVAKYKDGRPCVSVPKDGKVEMVFHVWFDAEAYQAKINRIIPLLEKASAKKAYCGQRDHGHPYGLVIWEATYDGPVPQEFSDWKRGETLYGPMAWIFEIRGPKAKKMMTALHLDRDDGVYLYPIFLDKAGEVLWSVPEGILLDEVLATTLPRLTNSIVDPMVKEFAELSPGRSAEKREPKRSYGVVSPNEYFRSYVFDIPMNVLRATAEVRCVLWYKGISSHVVLNDSNYGKVPPVAELSQGKPDVVDNSRFKETLIARQEAQEAAERDKYDEYGLRRGPPPRNGVRPHVPTPVPRGTESSRPYNGVGWEIDAPQARARQTNSMPSMAEQRAQFEQENAARAGDGGAYGTGMSAPHYNGDRPNVPAPGPSSERTGGIGAAVDSVSDGISGAIDSVKSLFW